MPVKDTKRKDTIQNLRQQGCTIYLEKSFTKNLGNYESTKVTVGGTFPISPTKGELELIRDTIATADKEVSDELNLQINQLMEELDK